MGKVSPEKEWNRRPIFSAHSTRHAATSAAYVKGISLETIRRTAGWSQGSQMFARVYNRPIETKEEFAKAVFQLD